MKKLYFLLFFVAVFSTSFAQYSSYSYVNPILKEHYEADVKNACLEWVMESDTNLFYSSAEIPPLVLDSIWQALSAVYYEFDMPERDSVIDMYCIHQFPKNHFLKEIILVPDWDNPLIINWLNHDPGYPILDSILTKYGFIIYDKEPKKSYILLRTEKDINIFYVQKLLKLVDGIIYADPNMTWGDGNGFTYRSSGTDRYLYFDKAWGDCMAGCYAHHIWQFKIDEYNDVEYMGTIRQYDEDDSVGEPWNCNITGLNENKEFDQLFISPNPIIDLVKFNEPFQSKTEYKIYNINGQLVKEGSLIGNETISISELKKGIYMIQLDDVRTLKFSKI